ncbi:transposase [Spirosoma lacussanchae]|uniref:IS5 family transposase n=1 Tax=Spirosoma lacussanchae TaxID=1884249 RepID=UPI00110836B5|nr:IS5 family transposase [Spirosoma lacussanchae]
MYPTDLTDSACGSPPGQVIEEILADKRKRKYSLRAVLNALLYLTKTGCQWRLLPNDLPPWPLCYYYFWKWRNDGRWEKLNKALIERRRKKAGRAACPSVGIIDSQSVKCSQWGVVPKGYDGHKHVNGRKRHIVVDTLGLVVVVVVHAANQHDSPAARAVLTRLADQGYGRMSKILADSAYGKKLARWLKKTFSLILEVVKVSELAGFHVVPMRWKVERTFAWMNWSRRLSKDYECGVSSHESFVYLSNINRMLKHF